MLYVHVRTKLLLRMVLVIMLAIHKRLPRDKGVFVYFAALYLFY